MILQQYQLLHPICYQKLPSMFRALLVEIVYTDKQTKHIIVKFREQQF